MSQSSTSTSTRRSRGSASRTAEAKAPPAEATATPHGTATPHCAKTPTSVKESRGKSSPRTGSANGHISILLVDDHAMFRSGVRHVLDGQPGLTVVGEARDGHECLDIIGDLKPQVVLLDMVMPEMGGPELLRQILNKSPDTRVLVLTMQVSAALLQEVLAGGAAGYLLKESAAEDLIRGIRVVMTQETYLCPRAAAMLVGHGSNGNGRRNGSLIENLSQREREVLRMIADGGANKEIASALHLSVKTVETHRARLMRKLELRTIADLTKCAIREGLTSVNV